MAPLPTLALARMIVRAYLNDDFILIIIYGNLRMGKSAYALKVLGQVYDYLKGRPLSIDLIDKYLGWDPLEVLDDWSSIKKRLPLYVWDDAGYWLYSLDWYDPLLIAISKYFNVIGTDMNSLILTTPDPTWILPKVLNMPGTIRVKVTKRYGGISDAPSVRYGRQAVGYRPYRSPDLKKTGVNRIFTDDFSCYIPDEIYSFYLPKREHYAQRAKENVREVILDKIKKKESLPSVDERIKVAVDSVKRRKGES